MVLNKNSLYREHVDMLKSLDKKKNLHNLQCTRNALTKHLQIHSLALGACLVSGHAQVMSSVGQLGRADMERAILSKNIPVQVRELTINPAELNEVS